MSIKYSKRWNIQVDTGGTFTDCIGTDPDGNEHRCKVLSSSALRGKITGISGRRTITAETEWDVPDEFISGFSFRVHEFQGFDATVTAFKSDSGQIRIDKDLPANLSPGITFEVLSPDEAPILAARVLTATPAGKELPDMDLRLATTKGTNALLERKGAPTALFITEGFGELLEIGEQHRKDIFSLKPEKSRPLYNMVIEVSERVDSDGRILTGFDPEEMKIKAGSLLKDGIRSAAVCLMNSYKNPENEQLLAEVLEELGFEYISVSSRISPFIKIIPRARTTETNAYLSPVMQSYFDNVSGAVKSGGFRVMTSSGGLVGVKEYTPKDSLLSGPAAGVVGAAHAGKDAGYSKILSFDMGGTSTDVSRYDGEYDYQFEHKVGDAELTAPAIAIETVAAGGGSVCMFDGFALQAGPGSASADPGPACYGNGGPVTITDVNLLLGRLNPENFHFPVDKQASEIAFGQICEQVAEASGEDTKREEILEGFLNIANERMAQAIRKISVQKGFDPAQYALVTFGGAGGQHACAVAGKLNISSILIPLDAGLLSARGLEKAEIERFAESMLMKPLNETEQDLENKFKSLQEEAIKKLGSEGVKKDSIRIRKRFIFTRLRGQNSTLELEWKPGLDIKKEFRKKYTEQFGHWIENREIEIESIRVVASAGGGLSVKSGVIAENRSSVPILTQKSWHNGIEINLPVYERSCFGDGKKLAGPALILDPFSTIFLEPGWQAEMLESGTIKMTRISGQEKDEKKDDEIIELELFTNRFKAVAGQMGEKLRRTAMSVNVKERLDFSCALLDPDGYLVANAPHIPVHLGAIGLCVRSMITYVEDNAGHSLGDGDVLITNHPAFGGSHLPDVTIVTPVYCHGERIGFTATRAHHAEIGGKSPGSMPADAICLSEEGVVIPPMHLIKNGKPGFEKLKELLETARYPSRTPDENMADIEAAIAANRFGAHELVKLTEKHSIEKTARYMQKLRSYAAGRLRQTIRNIPDGIYRASEYMDDDTCLKVKCTVSGSSLSIDFTGTSNTHPGNLNANPSIVNSVVMYVLRLLINEPLPLNDGLLDPVEIILPKGVLNPWFPDSPDESPAVVGGNVETSQRLTDTLLKAFGTVACSQGTMNNVLFGNDSFGYYETVGGGSGAGEGFNGTDAVHQHMTNTRATDPEILEYRYPVRINRYAIRKNSGGAGKWKGGNGIIREMTFLGPVRLTVLTQHRKVKPYGLKGGKAGKTGRQYIIKNDGGKKILDWRDSAEIESGDTFVLETPGGGGAFREP